MQRTLWRDLLARGGCSLPFVAERDYSGRDVLDKLGVRQGLRLAVDHVSQPLDPELLARVLERAGGSESSPDEPVDMVLVGAHASTDVEAVLRQWRGRLAPAGAIWVFTPKRGQEGYIDQARLIPMGLAAGLVDNKGCSVDDWTSALRFVIRRRDRPGAGR